MDYKSNQPINSETEDLLHRMVFSKKLAETVYTIPAKDGLVVGLFGAWGMGKSSILNLVENSIRELGAENDKDPIIIRFSPWSYTDKDHLISQFFSLLIIKIRKIKDKKLKKTIYKSLYQYAREYIVGNTGHTLVGYGFLFFVFICDFITLFCNEKELGEKKEVLAETLRNENKKIIVFIDDIDRLANTQIRDLFQLVNNIADFPNVIYILAMDRAVVVNALNTLNYVDGDTYLKKIIQLPIKVPMATSTQLGAILGKEVKAYINNTYNVTIDEKRWSDVMNKIIAPHLKTMRDVYRLFNVFAFKYGLIKGDVAIEDMMGIVALELFCPALYEWIFENKVLMCGIEEEGIRVSKNIEAVRERLEFSKVVVDYDLAMDAIQVLFPRFLPEEIHIEVDEHCKTKCIAHAERFDYYFLDDIDSLELVNHALRICTSKVLVDDLEAYIDNVCKVGKIRFFLEDISVREPEIQEVNAVRLVEIFLQKPLESYFFTKNYRYTHSDGGMIVKAVLVLLKKISKEENRISVIQSVMERANYSNLMWITELIRSIEAGYNRLGFQGNEYIEVKSIISENNIACLENTYLKKVKELFNDESSLYIKGYRAILGLWKRLDNTSTKEYIDKIFLDDVNKIKFVCIMATRVVGTYKGWMFIPWDYKDYIQDDEVYDIVKKLTMEKLERFTDSEKIKIIAYYVQRTKRESDHETDEVANKILMRWRKSFKLRLGELMI